MSTLRYALTHGQTGNVHACGLFWLANDMKVEDGSFEIRTDSWTDMGFVQVCGLFWIANDLKVEGASFEVRTDSWTDRELARA